MTDFQPHLKAELGRVFAEAGLVEEARGILAGLEDELKTKYISAVNFAKIYAGLGETDRFFESLQKAYEERSALLIWLNVWPIFDILRPDPRFTRLLRRVGFAVGDRPEPEPDLHNLNHG